MLKTVRLTGHAWHGKRVQVEKVDRLDGGTIYWCKLVKAITGEPERIGFHKVHLTP